MAETFQVVGGALATVDLALKLYKEIARFTRKVREADEVGKEMSMRYDGLTTTLGNVHNALGRRKSQLDASTRPADEGEQRVWSNIRRSLKSLRGSLRMFIKQLEDMDGSRDPMVKRKWIDRAIWQLKLDKRQPVFERLDNAAHARVNELTLSLAALQVFIHSDSAAVIEQLAVRIAGIDESLRKLSAASVQSPQSPPIPRSPVPTRRPGAKQQRQLQKCLKDASDIFVNSKIRVDSFIPEPDRTLPGHTESIWETGTESIAVAPDVAPVEDVTSDDDETDSFLDNRDNVSDASDEDEDEDEDDDTDLLHSGHSRISSVPSIARTQTGAAGEGVEAAQDTTQAQRNLSTMSNSSSTSSCNGTDSGFRRQLITAVRAKDAKAVDGLFEGRLSSSSIPDHDDPSIQSPPPASSPLLNGASELLRVSGLPLVHYAIKSDAGVDVVRALTRAAQPGIDINAREPDKGMTALHFAVQYNRYQCCAHLAALPGIHVDARNKHDLTPLALALHLSDQDGADVYGLAKLLLQNGATLPSKDRIPRGMTKAVDDLCRSWRSSQEKEASVPASGRKRKESSGGEKTMRRSSAAAGNGQAGDPALRKTKSVGLDRDAPGAEADDIVVRRKGLSFLRKRTSTTG